MTSNHAPSRSAGVLVAERWGWWRARPVLAFLVVAALQTAVLLSMVVDRASLLRSGREIVLPAVPVDPRDLFRGEYVILSYPVSEMPASLLQGDLPNPGTPLWVELARTLEEGWKPVAVSRNAPPAQPAGAEHVILAGRLAWSRNFARNGQRTIGVSYGLEAYFVEQGRGPELERLVGQMRLEAIVAVAPNGRAAIKGLAVDGRKIYDEPLL